MTDHITDEMVDAACNSTRWDKVDLTDEADDPIVRNMIASAIAAAPIVDVKVPCTNCDRGGIRNDMGVIPTWTVCPACYGTGTQTQRALLLGPKEHTDE